MKGSTPSARSVRPGSRLHMTSTSPTVVIRACPGVNSSVSMTVCTDQLSPMMRLIESPTELWLWKISERLCTCANRSRARL